MCSPIIVGVDGSRYAEAALKMAIQLAKFHEAKLVIASVYAYPAGLGSILDIPDSKLKEASARLKRMLEGYNTKA